MKLTVLTENTAGSKFLAEHGLSYLIEYNGKNILFDTGHSSVFLANSILMGLDIQKSIDTIVLSHGHWDHGDGLQHISNKILITHPNSFIRRFRKGSKQNIGLALSRTEIENKFNLIESVSPYYITYNIIFLGEIPRENEFESKNTSFINEHGNDDFVPDDSALAIIKNNELIVITGCSHSGICNIVEYAKKISGIGRVNTIMGGFHLKDEGVQTQRTIEYLKHLKVERILPSHCTELPALAAFNNEFKIQQVKTGQEFQF
jgi:7,8-dihydropterin-6-yl-methyl-4-(beta-D-ribofuranosyl)aminobenzene 5'-phosphate synthase